MVVRMMTRLVALVLALSLTACSTVTINQLSCKEITDSSLRAQIGEKFTPDEFLAWVDTEYPVTRADVGVVATDTGDEVSFSWKVNRFEYTANIRAGQLESAALRYVDSMKPTAAKIIACLGEPELYSARFGLVSEGGPQLDLDLLFPTQGVFSWGTEYLRFDTRQPPTITQDFPIASLIFMKPGSTDRLTRFLCWDINSEACQQIESSYKPWSGNWKTIEIGPQLQQ